MFYSMVDICKVTLAALFNMLATSRSCGIMCCFDQNYKPDQKDLQDSVLIKKLGCCIFWIM